MIPVYFRSITINMGSQAPTLLPTCSRRIRERYGRSRLRPVSWDGLDFPWLVVGISDFSHFGFLLV